MSITAGRSYGWSCIYFAQDNMEYGGSIVYYVPFVVVPIFEGALILQLIWVVFLSIPRTSSIRISDTYIEAKVSKKKLFSENL